MTIRTFFSPFYRALPFIAFAMLSHTVYAEGSRSLYPSSYPSANRATGARADLDLQNNARYLNRVNRRGFLYVYAEAGEYILFGSSNAGSAAGYRGDVQVYNPQAFGVPGDESIPTATQFTCRAGPTTPQPGAHYFGPDHGAIRTRAEELAGPVSADGSLPATLGNRYLPCAYQAPVDGVYGVLFTRAASGGGPDGYVTSTPPSTAGVAAWDIAVRDSARSTTDLNGRVFTYAFIGFTGGNTRPIFSTLYYVTEDGYRYQQDLRGLDPNGYALYANTFGFLDDNAPLYKTLRGNNWTVSSLPAGISAQPAEYPIFFSDIAPGGAAEQEVEKVLTQLNIPLTPPSPQISSVVFNGALGGSVTSTGVGGVFSFNTTDTVSYEIIISRDGVDFDGANPLNRVLTGIAYTGLHTATWNGLDNSLQPFPASVTPYAYRAYGRNGEVHFPIIDAENNGLPGNPAVPGGGPTITRLNGIAPNDPTVFFDDRGYVTSSGEAIGNLNGTLCPNPEPAAAATAVDLQGVDSSTLYRLWQNGGNANRDCRDNAGWGDAKAVNLWTYFLTPRVDAQLEVREFPVDVSSAVSTVDTAESGNRVLGTFSFSNNGTQAADVSYSLMLSPGLANVRFSNLPGPARYDSATGIVTLSGFDHSLAVGQSYTGLGFSYTAPNAGAVSATTNITATSATDRVPENNLAIATTGVGNVDVATQITGITAGADTGSLVTGAVLFSNVGTQDAHGVGYTLTIGTPGETPANVQFTRLPGGATALYDPATGEATLTGLPTTLVAGQVLSLSFSYRAPMTPNVIVPIASQIDTISLDAVPANDQASAASTAHRSQAGQAAAAGTGPVPVPVLPLPFIVLMVGLLGWLGVRALPARNTV